MLNQLDTSLEAFLRAAVPLPAQDVDVVFDAPDGDWAARVTRPTVNLYLWDIRRRLSEQVYGEELVETPSGRMRRTPLPRVDCRYLISAWTSEVQDEHLLLGAVLTAVLLNPVLEPEHLQPGLDTVRPLPTLELRSGDGGGNSDFWSALGGQLKPGLDLLVTATVDAAALRATAPPVTEVLVTANRRR